MMALALPPAAPPRYLALGDSYTVGESVEVADRWPVRLVALLRERGVAVGDAEIVARTGWTVRELVTPVSRRAATARSLIAGDGLHPSGALYAEWARLALPAATAALSGATAPSAPAARGR
jgi:lysophospholipase L1-like esterase